MTLDSQLQAAADETRERLSGFTPPPVPSSRQRLAPIAWMASAAALVVSVVVWSGITPLSRPADDEVYLGPGETLLSDKPTVVQGAPSVEPLFNVAELGEEAPLGPVTDLTELVAQVQENREGEVLRITAIGVTGDGATVALVHADEVGLDLRPLRLVCLWIDGWFSTCSGTPIDEIADQPGGLPDLQTESELVPLVYTIPGPSLLAAGSAPEGTSVVVFTSNGTSMWQRPVGGIAVFDIDLREGDVFVLTALDANGDTIMRRATTAGDDTDSGPAT